MRKMIGLGLALTTCLASTAALAQEPAEAAPAEAPPAEAAPAAAPAEATPAESAPTDAGKKIGIGADIGGFLPIGNLSDLTGLFLGGLVKAEVPVGDGLEVTGRIGYLYGLSKSIDLPSLGGTQTWKYSTSDIPIWAGARYFFDGTRQGAYAGAEVGLNMLSYKSESPIGDLSSSETKFGGNLAVGYKPGDLDIRASLLMLDIGHLGDTMAVGATVGYTFAKL